MEKEQLIKCCDQVLAANEDAKKWLTEYRPNEVGRQKNLRRVARTLEKCKRALSHNMSIGVFGPSQAGKSYLLSALAGNADGLLLAKFGQEEINFIAEINPAGGKESTGLVTRFTRNEPIGMTKDFPVHLELLSETDLVKIFANSFYQDVKASDVPLEEVKKNLNELKERLSKTVNGQVTSDDAEDLQEYIKDFKSNLVVNKLQETSFLEDLVNFVPYLVREDRLDLYSNLWNRNDKITSELRDLLLHLEHLQYKPEVNASLDSLIPREKSIIDVATLGINQDSEIQNEFISVKIPYGPVVDLPRRVLAALTAELTIVMPEEPAENDTFYQQTDFLDFPGYRARKEIHASAIEGSDARSMFLRGKVDYLFQRYRDRFELNSLLLCVGPSNQEAAGLPGAISKWIEKTHGKTPEERSFDFISLFFILTKADTQFEEVAGNVKTSGRWDIRFQASVTDYFGSDCIWIDNWADNKPFNNFFLLRNPNFKWRTIMEYDSDGRETGVQQKQVKYVSELQSDFMNSKFTQRHFLDKAEAWNALMSLNDGGISYIKRRIVPDPNLKIKQLALIISDSCRALLQQIEGFYRSDDKQEEFAKKSFKVLKIIKKLQAKNRFSKFPDLIASLTMQQNEFFKLSSKAAADFALYKSKSEDEREEKSEEDITSEDLAMELFGQIDGEENYDQEQNSEELSVEKDEDYFYARAIIEEWQNRMDEISGDTLQLRYFNLDRNDLDILTDNLKIAVDRLAIDVHLAKCFKEIRSKAANAMPEQKIRKQAAFASDYLNKFVAWLPGNAEIDDSDLNDRQIMVVKGKVQPIFPHLHEVPPGELPQLPETTPPSPSKGWTQSWMLALYEMVRCNVYEDNDPNPEQNSYLGSIIQKVKKATPNAQS